MEEWEYTSAVLNTPSASELPERTSRRSLPVIGYYPADYLLANGEDYSLKGGETSPPHDTYLFATLRLGQKLIQLVPLQKVSGLVKAQNPLGAHE